MNHRDPQQWLKLPTTVIADSLGRFQAMSSKIRRVSGSPFAGPALTVRTVAGDSSTLHRAVARATAGAVIVVDAGGYPDRAVWGEVLAVAATKAAVTGLVVDGVVRDVQALRDRAFPVFARGACPAGPHKGWHGEIGGRIQCGGVPVEGGDWIVADLDGVVAVPAGEMERVLSDAAARQQTEATWISRIEAGETSLSVLGID